MKCPSPPGAVPAANAAAAGGTRLSPARSPSRPGRGRLGACEAAPAAGPAGERAPGRGAVFVRRAASGGTRARAPPARRREAPAGRRARGSGRRRAPSRRGPAGSILCGERAGGGGDAVRTPCPDPALLAGSRAGVPGERPSAVRGACGSGRFVCPAPGPRAAGGRALGAGPGLGRGDARRERERERPPRTGGTDSLAAGVQGPPAHRRGEEARPREEGMDPVAPQSGLHGKEAAIWRLAVRGPAPKVEIGQVLDTGLEGCS
ncbi:nuclear transcription factor Y subunit beta isoform X1 [Myotis daubentonii]|uniref:nuclear transcription factor Y subunit beta isoform X1 n=1 Tax=Myotis daubentonii TaxID=98922 RepID=UPI002872FF37|nr:nuclear transcription factor Y subunit beta isoform X1 [Myotis daubentonii]